MPKLDALEKDLKIVFPPRFVHDFWRKMFFFLCSIIWPNFIAWLSLCLEILDHMYIVTVCFSGCGIINLKINHIFFIKPLFYLSKLLASEVKKHFFLTFKELSVAKSCIRPEIAPLKSINISRKVHFMCIRRANSYKLSIGLVLWYAAVKLRVQGNF